MYICSINNMMTRLTFNSINKIGIGKSIYVHVAPLFYSSSKQSKSFVFLHKANASLILGVHLVVAERAVFLLVNIIVHSNQTAMCLYMYIQNGI